MVEATKARVAPVSSAMLYGRGVFTTVAIYRGEPFLWPNHWQRLENDAAKLSLDLTGFNETSVLEPLRKLIAVNRVSNGRARVILLARSGRDIWKAKATGSRQTDLLIMTGEPHKLAQAGLSLAISPFRSNTRSPLAGIKSLNYLEHVMSWEEARNRDFDEAIVVNERGEIVSATMANIFWSKGGTIHTPGLSTGVLAGITRGCIVDIAAKHFVPLVEGAYDISDLTEAEEIFLTSSGLGVAPVTTFDFRRYAVESESVVTTIRNAFMTLVGA
ncbi:MAG: aminotransferase class IV [Pyrinomonadaceae bacterium]